MKQKKQPEKECRSKNKPKETSKSNLEKVTQKSQHTQLASKLFEIGEGNVAVDFKITSNIFKFSNQHIFKLNIVTLKH
jgi:hypothetical protein